jgi:hypothetical protein
MGISYTVELLPQEALLLQLLLQAPVKLFGGATAAASATATAVLPSRSNCPPVLRATE